jgi:hypothetical protein
MREDQLTEEQLRVLSDMRSDLHNAYHDALAAGRPRQEAIALARGVARSYYLRGIPWPLCYKEMVVVIAVEAGGE